MRILLIVYNNDSFIHFFPLGLAYLASILRNEGHSITIYNQDLHHYPEEHLTKYLDSYCFDIVGIGLVAGYYPYKKLLRISEAINNSKNRRKFRYIIGGHMVSADPLYFCNKTGADAIFIGESDISIKTFCEKNERGFYKPILVENLDDLPLPAWDLFPMFYYKLQRMPNISNGEFSMSVITGRGCLFFCTFCFKIADGIRLRSIGSIMEEINKLYTDYGITYIDFADDLTLTSPKRTEELCEAILNLPFKIKWRCEGRLNFVKEEDLKLMKRSGCVFINYGIESLNKTVLKNIKKNLTKEQITNGVDLTLKEEISPGLNFMWGNIGDTEETLKESVDFLLKYDDGVQLRTIRPVTPYPGCELFETAKIKGLVKDTEDFYENKHLNSDLVSINFTDIPTDKMHELLHSANKALITSYYQKKLYKTIDECENLYINKNINFRGYRQT